MLVEMNFAELRSMDVQSISWKCVEPLLMQVRGQSIVVKESLVQQLNPAQVAIFMFYAFHNHIGSAAELYWFTQYYMTDVQAWPAIKNGVHFYEDQVMLDILEEVESIVTARNHQEAGSWLEARPSDLEQDGELSTAIQRMYDKYRAASAQTISKMNAYVSQHLNEFFVLV
ncbi:hypothetical protein D3C76_62190 [compost metagenome]